MKYELTCTDWSDNDHEGKGKKYDSEMTELEMVIREDEMDSEGINNKWIVIE